jgi:hypothetical protein
MTTTAKGVPEGGLTLLMVDIQKKMLINVLTDPSSRELLLYRLSYIKDLPRCMNYCTKCGWDHFSLWEKRT